MLGSRGGETAGTGGAAEAGVHWCVQCAWQTVMLGGDLDIATLGLNLGSESQMHRYAQLSDCDSG